MGSSRVVLILVSAVLLRWSISYHPYSGQGKPPMFGDYEAQRHWQEITFNLPSEEWYANSTDNDLQYWGLDYPPLTAYHSLLIGHVANRLDPDFVKLRISRGYESESHKFFMRLTVLLADLLVYIPAVYWFFSKATIAERLEHRRSNLNVLGLTRRDTTLLTALIYPGLVLVDYGHFQYNCVSLGFFVAAVSAISEGRQLVASFLFTLALNYKQMELYHSLPFFFVILGSNVSFGTRSISVRWRQIIYVALVVVTTFIVSWMPFIRNVDTFTNVIARLFPIARGIFEDKVANVWCTLNIVYKLRDAFDNLALAKICLAATLISLLPSNLHLFFKPSIENFILSLINTSLAFFLFSFQVHEKSILLIAVPVALHLHQDPLPCFWFLIISNFSMLPLYVKDDLLIAFVATTILYVISVYWMFSDSLQANANESTHIITSKVELKISGARLGSTRINFYHCLEIWGFYISMLGALVITTAMLLMKPPRKYPDLFPVLISTYCCGHFILFVLYFNYKQFTRIDSKNKDKLV